MSDKTLIQKALDFMGGGGWHTSLNIAEGIGTVAVGSTMADLRKKGYTVESEYVGKSGNGRSIYKYRLVVEIPQKPPECPVCHRPLKGDSCPFCAGTSITGPHRSQERLL